MNYQVIARKWRPQTFSEIVGQETVSRTLRNALASGRIAHAFLFSGVRGVGKTSVARILAKALNCHRGVTDDPCCACPSCEEIRDGNSVDVQEIDAASNRGIDSIRELRDGVRYGAARDRFKIYIVDEVHMLTNEAFNALLKTLEEPPAHVKFILATTEYHKIPPTITSRCQKYEFKPVSFSGILQRLRAIVQAENVEVSDTTLHLVASAAQGSMRDAQSALEQLIAFGGSRIEDEDARALLGVIDQGVVSGLLDAVAGRDRAALIAGIRELADSGVSAQTVCGKLVERVRHLMVCKAAGWNESLLQLPDSDREPLLSQVETFSQPELIRFYDILNRTSNELRWHTQPSVHLEITLLKLIELADLAPIEEVLQELRSGTASFLPETTPAARPAAAAASDPPTNQPRGPIGFARPAEETAAPDPVHRLMDRLRTDFKGLYSQLEQASEIAYADGRLKIRFAATESIHADSIADNRGRLSETFANILGSKPEIEVQIEPEQKDAEKPVNPTDDPRVRAFIERYPGKVLVRKTSDPQ
jgi:DNA polymerase III subunit gamma/tau